MSRISIARRAAALLFLSIVLPGAVAAAAGCAGDCNDDGEVKVNELITGVNIVLGSETLDRCASVDGTGDGQIAINELIAAVGASLDGCPEPVDRLDSVGAVTLGVARGLSGLAAVFQNLISTVNAVNGSNDPDPTVNECPVAGGYTLECLGVGPFRVRNTFVWQGCRYAAPGGTLTLAGTIVGNSAGACPSLILPPVTLEIDFSLTFEDGTTGATRTVAIDATGTISTVAFEERPCPLKGGEAAFTGTIHTTSSTGGEERFEFDGTRLALRLSEFFGDNCQPGSVRVTVDGATRLTDERAEPPLTFDAMLTGMQAEFRDAEASGGTSTVAGAITSSCLGGQLTVATAEPIGGGIAAACPSTGVLDAVVDGRRAQIAYQSDGSLKIDSGADGSFERTFSSCLAPELRSCAP